MKSLLLCGQRPARVFRQISTACCAALLLFSGGCPTLPNGDPTNDNTNDANDNSDSGEISGEIINVSQIVQISELEEPLSVLYTVTAPTGASISPYYLPTGESQTRVTIGGTYAIGTGQFGFDPTGAGVGTYYVGLIVTADSQVEDIVSTGVIQVQGPPRPVFIRPAVSILEVAEGEDVAIAFDAGDPEGNVQWRAFYLTAADSRTAPADELGTQLGPPGSGNVGTRILVTAGLTAGDYQLGLSATDSGSSVSATVAKGDDDQIVTVFGPIVRVVEDAEAIAPMLNIEDPGATDVEIFGDEEFTIQVKTAVRDPRSDGGLVEVFYDFDTESANGFADFIGTATVGPATEEGQATTLLFSFPGGLPEGSYYIGASIDDGVNSTVYDYAAGAIVVVTDPILSVTAPDISLPVPPADPTDPSTAVAVSWTTNVPASGGTIDVFVRRLDKSGTAIGPEEPILEGASTNETSVWFYPEESGIYGVTVRLSLADPTITNSYCTAGTCALDSPQPVRVSSLPPVLWLGALTDTEPPFDGAVFQGISSEDNTGSALTTAGDLDGDGSGDFVVAARYGKADIGTGDFGPGDAFVIYGASGSDILTGVYELRTIGSSALRGVRVAGIATADNSGDTDGLAAVALIPDVDGDGLDDLAFGFPRVDSSCSEASGALCSAGQFLNGGVVVVSSDTPVLWLPDFFVPWIDCGDVGQVFSDQSVQDTATLVVEDQLAYDGVDACEADDDGIDDTIVGPVEGFVPLLASPADGGFEVVSEGTSPREGTCPTQYDVQGCAVDDLGLEVGSGFYPAETVAQSPYGARIIGADTGGGFGTSIAIWSSSSASVRDALLISAPEVGNEGLAYFTPIRNLWGPDGFFPGAPPTPHQYLMGEPGYCGAGRADPLSFATITGNTSDEIKNMIGLRDFNDGGWGDFAVGVSAANGGRGRVYIVFSESAANYPLANLARSPTDPLRLDGVLLQATSSAGLGASLATDVDFNADGRMDLVIGSPNASDGAGEVIVVFGDPQLESGADGLTIDALLAIRNEDGDPRGVRIVGVTADNEQGRFGFNVANGGDIDGDGFNDLLVAAPEATPRFDSDPADTDDVLDVYGVDADFDGEADDVSGPDGTPDGTTDDYDKLTNAGVVYVIYGSNRLDQLPLDDAGVEISIGIEQLGSDGLRGFMIAGNKTGDRLGGGDAGESANGGILAKKDRGRSSGLASAGDVDGDGRSDLLIGSILADPQGSTNAGEAYLIYGSVAP